MKARVDSARADLLTAKAAVNRAIATEKSAAAWVRYRLSQRNRMEALYQTKSIAEQVAEESKEHHEASVQTELSAKEAIAATKAGVVSSGRPRSSKPKRT